MATVRLRAKNTVTPVLLNRGDTLKFTLRNGETRVMELLETGASVMRTNVEDFAVRQECGGSLCEFTCQVRIDGHEMMMQRYLPAQETFYEPYVVNGMRIWFDAVQDYFALFTLSHGRCMPRTHARFAVSDAMDPVAPGLAKWYPNDANWIGVEECYLGDDPWMGPYLGASPHAGLDVNTPEGTPLYAPMDCEDQWLRTDFTAKPHYWAAGWAGTHQWPNGAVWTLSIGHLSSYLVEEHEPVKAGTQVAEAAGTCVGARPHSHFRFTVEEEEPNAIDGYVEVSGDVVGESDDNYAVAVEGVTGMIPKRYLTYKQRRDRPELSVFFVPPELADERGFAHKRPVIYLDPWYLFWQMFEDDKARKGETHAYIAPLSPAKTGASVQFSSAGSRVSGDSILASTYWTFGDGGWSDEANPTHTFVAPGVYPVSLIVDDGRHRHRYTQHITVDGPRVERPSLALAANEPSFQRREAYVTDVYGAPIRHTPHTLNFVARSTRPMPEPRNVSLTNVGGGELSDATVELSYEVGDGWASAGIDHEGNAQRVTISVDTTGLASGTYTARAQVSCPGALNSPQGFRIVMEVRATRPTRHIIVDCRDPEFYATPFFWIGGRWHRWDPGFRHFLLTGGGRAKEGEYYRATPDLADGMYAVSFPPETPWAEQARCKVRVHHADGDTIVWMEPAKSRRIGIFRFNEGTDGYVQVYAEGSEGEILADAVSFGYTNPSS